MKKITALLLLAALLLPFLPAASAAILYGDSDGDGEIGAKDSALLRSYLANYDYVLSRSPVSVSQGADCDGDGSVSARDIALLRKYLASYDYVLHSSPIVLGPARQTALENLYSFTTAYCGLLDADGGNEYSYLYMTSAPIAVTSGDVLTFGPVREYQKLFVTTFDASGAVRESLTSASSLTKNDVCADGRLICSLTVPAGVAAVRLTCEAVVYNTFLVTRNDPFSAAEYERYWNEQGMEKYLRFREERDGCATAGKSLLWCGDSIGVGYYEHEYPGTAAAGITSRSRNTGTNPAWAKRIVNLCGMKSSANTSKGGASLSTKRADVTNIYTQLSQNACSAYDYIFIEGGSVDVGGSNGIKVPLGQMKSGYQLSDFDGSNTFIGALERCFYYAVTKAPGAHIVFLIPYSMPEHPNNSNAWNEYWQYVPFVCEKWGIPYIDLYNNEYVNKVFDGNRIPGGSKSETAFYTDALHVSPMGYTVTALEIAVELEGISAYSVSDRRMPAEYPAAIGGSGAAGRSTGGSGDPENAPLVNLYDAAGVYAGRMSKTGENISDPSKYVTTDYLAVKPGDTVWFGPAVPTQGYQLNAYDKYKTVVTGWIKGAGLTVADNLADGRVIYGYEVPANVSYVRITLPVGSRPVITVNQKFNAAAYEAAVK